MPADRTPNAAKDRHLSAAERFEAEAASLRSRGHHDLANEYDAAARRARNRLDLNRLGPGIGTRARVS